MIGTKAKIIKKIVHIPHVDDDAALLLWVSHRLCYTFGMENNSAFPGNVQNVGSNHLPEHMFSNTNHTVIRENAMINSIIFFEVHNNGFNV